MENNKIKIGGDVAASVVTTGDGNTINVHNYGLQPALPEEQAHTRPRLKVFFDGKRDEEHLTKDDWLPSYAIKTWSGYQEFALPNEPRGLSLVSPTMVMLRRKTFLPW